MVVGVVRTLVRLVLVALLCAACGKPAEPVVDERPVAVVVAKPQSTKPTKPRHAVMAEKVVAAVAANDYAQLRALSSDLIEAELGDLNRRKLQELVERLESEKIDLSKAKLISVEPVGDMIEMNDIILEYQGRTFRMHFSVMTSRGQYALMGVATWIQWEKPS